MRLLPVLVVGSLSLSAIAANAATTSCSSVAACVMGANSSSGAGVAGTSKSGFGLSGTSTSGHGVNGTSSSSFGVVGITTNNAVASSTARSGVLGQDASTSTNVFNYNSGVSGTSNYGTGVFGSSNNATGVIGASTTHVGICGESSGQKEGQATLCQTSGAVAVSANSDNGTALDAFSGNGFAAFIENLTESKPVLSVIGGSTGTPAEGSPIFDVQHTGAPGKSSYYILQVDEVGNLSIKGTLTMGTFAQYRTATSTGKYVTSYGARESVPTLEDFGENNLKDGLAYVRLDPTFSSTLDRRQPYMVFLTPNGSSRGLYVTNKTSSGFEVKENGNGRSTLTFDYRIVAKSADAAAGQRLTDYHSHLDDLARRPPVEHRFEGLR